jgi:serine/threonine-protein kinase ULK4
MLKDQAENEYSKAGSTTQDIKMTNKDQEITIGGEDKKPKKNPVPEEPGADENDIVDIKGLAQKEAILSEQSKPQLQKRNSKLEAKDEIRKDLSAKPMGLDPNAPSPSTSKVPLKTIDLLLIHNSDTAVKPIIGNKEIEKTQEITFKPSNLPFESWSPEQVAEKIETVEIESHLHDVYNAMAASGTVNDKLNVLIYFELIILNSAFMNLLIKLLKNVKSPHLKLRLCSILGQLIRHSTVIGNEVAESGIS